MTSGSLTPALSETVALFDASGTPQTTSEVADRLDLGRRSTYDRLERLVDHGELATKKVGGNGRVWWRPVGNPTTQAKIGGRTVTAQRQYVAAESLFDAVKDYAIFFLDSEGYIQSWNDGARHIMGYEQSEIIGEHFSVFYTAVDQADGVPAQHLDRAVEAGGFDDEGWRLRDDASRFWATVTITPIFGHGGTLQEFGIITRDMTEHREHELQLRRERDVNERVFETSPIGLGILSKEGLERVNARAAEIYGSASDDIPDYVIGEPKVYDADGQPVPPEDRPNARVFETGEPVDAWECQLKRADGTRRWLSVSAAPLSVDEEIDRVIVATEDITNLKEQARQLERHRESLQAELDDVFARVDDGFFALNEQWEFTYLNAEAERLLGVEQSALIGRVIWEAIPSVGDLYTAKKYRRAMETQETVSFEAFDDELGTWFEVYTYPSESGLSVYFRDITDRKAREQALRRYETLVTAAPDAVYMLDADGTIDLVNYDALTSLTGYTQAELEGRSFTTLLDAADVEKARDGVREMLTATTENTTVTQELTIRGRDGREVPCENHMAVITGSDGELEAVVGTIRDISEQKAREHELELYETIIETIDDGVYVLDEDFCFTEVNGAYVDMTGYDREALLGAHCTLVIDEEVSAASADHLQEINAGEANSASLEADLHRADGSRLRAESRFTTLESAAVEQPLKVGVVRDVSERVAREQELHSQRERLAALDDLNRVVRDLSEAIIEQSTRAEIEQTVCDGLAASDSYSFAWIGEVDSQSRTMHLRTEAGVEGYLEDVTISVDPADPKSQGPTGRAVQTHEIQVSTDTIEDESYAQWRENARAWGFRSSAAIPIVHEEILYGVLNVYADRPNAFTSGEREVIDHLGEIIGHAIAAVEQKRALTSDEVVDLEFQISGIFDAFDLPVAGDGWVSLDRSVPAGDDVFLEYGTATTDMLPVLETLEDTLPHWDAMRFLGETDSDDVVHFELRLVDPPVLSAIMALGGYVDQARIEDGDYYMRIHLAPSADARRVIDVVTESYPMAQLTTRQQVTRETDVPVPFAEVLADHLTDRQRAALETAYFAGYFEWPREITGEELAESLSVSPSTFHQHLRVAQRKVLHVALAETASV